MRHRRNRNAEVLLSRDFETKKHSWKKKKFLTKLTEHSFEPHRQQHEVVHVYSEIFAGVTKAQHLVQAAGQTNTWNHRKPAALWKTFCAWQMKMSLVTNDKLFLILLRRSVVLKNTWCRSAELRDYYLVGMRSRVRNESEVFGWSRIFYSDISPPTPQPCFYMSERPAIQPPGLA